MNWKEIRNHAIGILVLSVIITIVIADNVKSEVYNNLFLQFLIALLNTVFLWVANSSIFYFLQKRFPLISQTRNRILAEVAVMSVATTLVAFALYYFLCYIPNGTDWNVFWIDLKYSFLFTGLAVVFHESVFFYKRWNESILAAEKLQKESTQAQLESLRTQVNPHFLFNSLNTLVALIPLDAQKSIEFVRKLSEVYRFLLKAQNSELISVEEEMKVVSSYLFLLETRFQNALQVEVQVQVSVYSKFIPPVSIQLLIENCVKHNVISKYKTLHIKIYVSDNDLIVQNTLQKKNEIEDSTGMGLSNIRKRYALLSERTIDVKQTAEYFIVRLPLLEIQTAE